jgi:hypothetical protein
MVSYSSVLIGCILKSKMIAAFNKARRIMKFYFKTYNYDPGLYPTSFIVKSKKVEKINLKVAPKIIYIFWTGENEITPNRKVGIDSLINHSGVMVVLITPKNLNKYILKDAPLHEGYELLSLNHKSDYLRCYFMLHYGGGYSDIKVNKKSWKKAFILLNSKSEKWALGYQEIGHWGIRKDVSGKLGKDLKEFYPYLLGNGAFIYKPYSPIAMEWMDEIHCRLDELFDELKTNPATDIFGSNEGYPIPWAHITGDITQSLYLKYYERLIHNNAVLPSMENYK